MGHLLVRVSPGVEDAQHLKLQTSNGFRRHPLRTEPLQSLFRFFVPVVKVPKVVDEPVQLMTQLGRGQFIDFFQPEVLGPVTPGAPFLLQHPSLGLGASGEEEEGVRLEECD